MEKRPYETVVLPLSPADPSALVLEEKQEEIAERMRKTIDAEAPIKRSLLYKRVIYSYGLRKLGRKLLEAFDRASRLLEMPSGKDGDGEDVFGETSSFFRPSPDASVRYSYQIPDGEAANCLIYILENNGTGTMTKSELKKAFLGEMGWSKRGSEIDALFQRAVCDSRIGKTGNGRMFLKV